MKLVLREKMYMYIICSVISLTLSALNHLISLVLAKLFTSFIQVVEKLDDSYTICQDW